MRRGQQHNPFVIFALLNSLSQGFIPPVTLALILGQCLIHYVLAQDLALGDICFHPYWILQGAEYLRFALAAFFHADDMHLYYNMTSLAWKGRLLEPRFGSYNFGVLVAGLTALCSFYMLIFSWAAFQFFDYPNWYFECSVGFSGVLFALKVILNHQPDQANAMSAVLGLFPIPGRYLVWAELVVIQLLVPRVSFFGHLCGILAGLSYVYGPDVALKLVELYNPVPIPQRRATYTDETYDAVPPPVHEPSAPARAAAAEAAARRAQTNRRPYF
eukprot:gnl/Hemi2/4012_TR1397_c0_g1_i1.p1 gnl/Hemi2/4012_TR1397_c0_g1~~gnl/Hemi2/4012_TR1397_c0_g1_i1.p1  ORF type:complete len:273 (-),score=27.29 gnl/Hemi2/4012_TR1397_c0_g1_i1:68-886(-)